jgi:colicin import membrane protein
MTFRLPHLLAALALHVLVLGLLFGGVQCSAKPHKPPVISAVLLDPSRQDEQRSQRDAQRKLEQQRQAEAERKRREDEARRQAEAQKKAAEQKKAEEQKRLQAEAEAQKKKAAEAQRQKQLKMAEDLKAAELKKAEQKKAEEAARHKQEQAEQAAAAKREADERARVEQAMREEALRRDADLEQRARAEGERQTRLAEWADALVRHVQRNYTTPPGAPDDFSCQVRMQLLPDGTVTNAKIVKSCGSPALDRAVEDAVYRSSPLPKPADPSVFDRDLTINFTP